MIKFFLRTIVFLYKLIIRKKYLYFMEGLKDPKSRQLDLRKELEADYKKTVYFEKYDISFSELKIKDYNNLIQIGPVEEWCGHEIVCFEETSGSSGVKKKIPYTSKLLKSFSNMFLLWSYDVIENVPFKSFKFYFSISPQFTKNENGFNDDSEYLGPILSKVMAPFFVQLKGAKSISNSQEFLMKLSLTLVSERELEILSIWSPTFLMALLDFIKENKEEFLAYLKEGHFKDLRFKPIALKNIEIDELFPSLKFISCWGSGAASKNYNHLREQFPKDVVFQKKGLLATEAPMTLPLIGYSGAIPLISEVFFEFINKEGEIKYLWELNLNETYDLVISQKGGLIRYPMRDLVTVVGFIEKTPLLDFVGRSVHISDLVGEKVDESQAIKALGEKGKALIASLEEQRYYVLSESPLSDQERNVVEDSLRENIHYHNARELGQLKEPKFVHDLNWKRHLDHYYHHILKINPGDVKETALIYRKSEELLKLLRLDH